MECLHRITVIARSNGCPGVVVYVFKLAMKFNLKFTVSKAALNLLRC